MNLDTAVSNEHLTPGHRLGQFELLAHIAAGGEANIWSALDSTRQEIVALRLSIVNREEYFESKASNKYDLITTLDHPHIARVYSVDLFNDVLCLTNPFYPVGSLQDLIDQRRLSLTEVMRFASQITAALDYIHSRDVVHRDVKPSNILLDAKHRIYLTDFGLARPLSETTRALHTGHGTRLYAPPEQHTRKSMTYNSDIYSFGITLFQMLTGKLPWEGSSALAILQMDDGELIPDPRSVDPDLPRGLWGILCDMTALNPDDRPSNVVAAFDLLAGALEGSTVDFSPAPGKDTLLDRMLETVEPLRDPGERLAEDALYLYKKALSEERRNGDLPAASLTEYAFINSVFANADRYGLILTDAHRTFMLQNALYLGTDHQQWWDRLTDPAARMRVCEGIIGSGNQAAIERALTLLIETPGDIGVHSELSAVSAGRLIDVAVDAKEDMLAAHALSALQQAFEPAVAWQPFQFSVESDSKLGLLALRTERAANRRQAIGLIARMRSEAAVAAVWKARQRADQAQRLAALAEVLEAVGTLPHSLPSTVRLRAISELVVRQLGEDRPELFKAFLACAAGCGLGLGVHVFWLYRLPSYLDTIRILNAVGSGLIFGPVIGLGILVARLIGSRLRSLAPVPRVAVSAVTGALIVNVGIVGLYLLFLNRTPVGGLIGLGSFIWALGFGISALPRSRTVRVVISVFAVFSGIVLTWGLSLLTGLSPLLYYETTWPAANTLLLMATFSLLVGILGNSFSLAGKRGAAGI